MLYPHTRFSKSLLFFAIAFSLSQPAAAIYESYPSPTIPPKESVQEAKFLDLSWDVFSKDTETLATKLKKLGPWKGMVAITRGGLVPAALLSHHLKIKTIDTISIASYSPDRTRSELKVLKGTTVSDDGEGWLVVDDLVDSGATLQKVKEILPKAHVAVVYAKPQGIPAVDTYAKPIAQDTWIVFPWEREE